MTETKVMAATLSTPSVGVESLPLRAKTAARLARLRPEASWALARFSVDASMLCLAAFAAVLGARSSGVPVTPPGWLAAFGLVALVCYGGRGMYGRRLRLQALDDVRFVVTSTAIAAMGLVTLRLVVGDAEHLAADVLRPWAFATAYVAAGRVALTWSERSARRRGESGRTTLVIGSGRIAQLTAKRLEGEPDFGLRPVGFLDDAPLEATDVSTDLTVLGGTSDVERIVEQYGVQHAIVTFTSAPLDVLTGTVERLEELGVKVSFIPRLYEKVNGTVSIEHLGGLPLMTPHRPDPRGWHFALKYGFDRLVATVGLFFVWPILLGAALAVYVSMGRPIFFRQVRVGRDGRPFEILKFRSMKLAAPEEAAKARGAIAAGSAPGGVEGSDRRTRAGAILRCTSIDELPQLLNVLKGQMSIVGPRPERPEFVELFDDSVHRYGERHRVKAGITGWAQVHGLRGKTSIADRAEWDNYYIENWSLWLDVKILFLTVAAVFRCFREVE